MVQTRSGTVFVGALLAGVSSCAAPSVSPKPVEVHGIAATDRAHAPDARKGGPRRSTTRLFPDGTYFAIVSSSVEESCSESVALTTTRAVVALRVSGASVRVSVNGEQSSTMGAAPFASVAKWTTARSALVAELDGKQRLGDGAVHLALDEGTLLVCVEGFVEIGSEAGGAGDGVDGFDCKLTREFASVEDQDDAESLARLGDSFVFAIGEPLVAEASESSLGPSSRVLRRPSPTERTLIDAR